MVNGLIAEAYEQRNGVNTKRMTLEVHGKKAHAGVNPQEGANAVVELAHKIQALKELSTNFSGVNITPVAIKGGTVKNVVPDEAMVVFDIESQDGRQIGEIESALRLLFKMNTIAA
ncbi:peptidase dimerization domain-containing protein [Candidatus Gottesmanbacteria bacterium]|nr:peptidase dimerization domain-containing protein [Candidatus Gottesmanbacteria bacterium]